MKALVEQEVGELIARLGRMPESDRPWAIAKFTSMLGRQDMATVNLIYEVLRARAPGTSGPSAIGNSIDLDPGPTELVADLLQSVAYVRESRL
ncbi:MAG TPA: hypothetical protein VI893_01840 [Thermoplasmata archaeon]|nr:hypothetical protein [Thermoplasmata archaeon]